MDPKKEQKLIREAKRGNERAFGELYNAYVHDIYKYVLYRVGSPEMAQDLTADVFVRAIDGLARYEERQIPLLAWLYRIAHARVIDHYRREKRVGEHEDIDTVEVSVESDLDTDLMDNFQQQKIREALRKLPSDQQQVLLMRFIEGYNIQKTADILGKSIGAVKMIQRRALQAMNFELSRQGIKPDRK